MSVRDSLSVSRAWEGLLWDFIIQENLEDEFKEFVAKQDKENEV